MLVRVGVQTKLHDRSQFRKRHQETLCETEVRPQKIPGSRVLLVRHLGALTSANVNVSPACVLTPPLYANHAIYLPI